MRHDRPVRPVPSPGLDGQVGGSRVPLRAAPGRRRDRGLDRHPVDLPQRSPVRIPALPDRRYQRAHVLPSPLGRGRPSGDQAGAVVPPNHTGEKAGEELTREVMVDRLARLEKSQPDEAVIVYLSTRAMVDDAETVQIVAADSDPYAPRTLLPLRSVLASLKKSPARNKLLVLDIMSAPPSPLELGGTSDGVADLIARELNKDDDPSQPLIPGSRSWRPARPGRRHSGRSRRDNRSSAISSPGPSPTRRPTPTRIRPSPSTSWPGIWRNMWTDGRRSTGDAISGPS